MSGYPHGLTAPGNDYVLRGTEIKPVLHIIDWRKDGAATVRWCGAKYLFKAALVLKKGETKPCPVCAIELRYDRQKKEVVEGGFPCVPNRTGGQMTAYHEVRDALCKLRDQPSGTMGINGQRLLTDAAAFTIAPIIVKFGRAQWLAGYHAAIPTSDPEPTFTAGVAAMTEGP